MQRAEGRKKEKYFQPLSSIAEYIFCFVCLIKLRFNVPVSLVGTEPSLPGYNQFFWEVKCLAQGHNTAEIGFDTS